MEIRSKILTMKDFDAALGDLIELMDLTCLKLERYKKIDKLALGILEHYEQSIYRSLTVSKMMEFTNTAVLDSSLQFNFVEITEKLAYVVMGLYQSLRNVYLELRKSSIKTHSEHKFRQRAKNLRGI